MLAWFRRLMRRCGMPDYRQLFHIPGQGPYVLTHSAGCLPRSAADALQTRYFEPWRTQGGDAWGTWLDAVNEFRAALAALFGGTASQWCPQVNISSALTKLLGALPAPDPTRSVWALHEDSFPSIGFVMQQAARLGHRLRLVPRDLDPGLRSTWDQALAPDVCGVVLSHVHSNTGRVAPVDAVAQLCRQRNVLCVVDAAQSAGILPWSVESLGADAVLGSCIKWLCGGPGAGFLWLRPELCAQLEPLDVGWFSHEDPFEFDIRHYRPAADARRFWGGTPDVAPLVIAAQSLREIQRIGVAAILAHNRSLIEVFCKALPQRWRAEVRVDGFGGTLCLPAGSDADRVAARLSADGARFDRRGNTLRLSFHLCNDTDDAARLAQAFLPT
jgi:selenocysteine lyase/cysteine desulfurase